jgi:hypothetical protein
MLWANEQFDRDRPDTVFCPVSAEPALAIERAKAA